MHSGDFTSFSREERKWAKEMRNLVIRYADARDAVGNASIRIWRVGNEIYNDTPMKCLGDRLAFSRSIGNETARLVCNLPLAR